MQPKSNQSKVTEQATDAAFLAEEFGIQPNTAAELVQRDGASADDVADATRKKLAEIDPLAGVPVPDEPATDLTKDNDEVRLKPVVRDNNRVGGG